MTDHRLPPPLDRLADAFLHVPVGLLLDGPAPLDRAARNGRTHVRNAWLLGKFSVDAAAREVGKRFDGLDGPLADLVRVFAPDDADRRARTTPATRPDAEVAADVRAVDGGVDADELPLADYDSLTAKQVISRLRGLDAEQLALVDRYEASGRDRRTVRNRIRQLGA